jgi:hypothetical protein
VRRIVEAHGPITLTLGKTGVFEKAGGGKFDVVQVGVDSPQLHALNAELSKLPNGDEHPTYQPHMTLAYVKPGRGRQVQGLQEARRPAGHHQRADLLQQERRADDHPAEGRNTGSAEAADTIPAETKSPPGQAEKRPNVSSQQPERAAEPSTGGEPNGATLDGMTRRNMAQERAAGQTDFTAENAPDSVDRSATLPDEGPAMQGNELQPPSEADLIAQIERHWQENDPQRYARLRKAGTLHQDAQETAEATARLARNLQHSGLAPHEAWDQAMSEVALSL